MGPWKKKTILILPSVCHRLDSKILNNCLKKIFTFFFSVGAHRNLNNANCEQNFVAFVDYTVLFVVAAAGSQVCFP